MLDPSIPLNANAPQPTPLARTLGAMVALRGGQLENQQRQQQIQQNETVMAQQQQMGEEQTAADERLRAVFASANGQMPPPEAIVAAVGWERGSKIVTGIGALQAAKTKAYDDKAKVLRDAFVGYALLPEDMRAKAHGAARSALVEGGVVQPGEVPEQYDPAWFQRTIGYGKTPEKPGAPIQLDPTKELRDPTGQTVIAPARPEPVKPPTAPASVQEWQFYADEEKRAGRVPMSFDAYQTMDANRKRSVVNVNPGQQEDINTLAEDLRSGRILPTDLAKRGSDYNKIIAKASRDSQANGGKPMSLNSMKLDYAASSKWVQSQNGQPAQRFYSLATSVVNTIDEVRTLADEMDQSGIVVLNKLALEAQLKVLGNTEKGQLVARYLGAVTTLKEEFANLVQGGYAPTEAAFKLANQQINENYGVKAMNAGLTEVQRLIGYRINAFKELKPRLVAEVENGTAPAPPSPAAAGASDRVRVKGPNGESGTVPKGTTLGPGWVIVK